MFFFVKTVTGLALALTLATPALAQQPPDLTTLQKAVVALQAQRNSAMDEAAGQQVRAATLAEENAKLKAEIEEMKKAAAQSPPQK